MVLVDQSTLWKISIFFDILLAPCNVLSNTSRDFLGKFPRTGGFPDCVSQMGFVSGCVENPLESLMFTATTWAGRTEASRSVLHLHFTGSARNFYGGFLVTASSLAEDLDCDVFLAMRGTEWRWWLGQMSL